MEQKSKLISEINRIRRSSVEVVLENSAPPLIPFVFLGMMLDDVFSLSYPFRTTEYLKLELDLRRRDYEYAKIHGKFPG